VKARIQQIEIQNFKAFRNFSLKLEGRHLLLYGENGSGKSSLYWALYTFLQSGRKPTTAVSRYFDPANTENLLNIHEDETEKPGDIALTIRDMVTKNDTTYHIGKDVHGTNNIPAILKGDLASDFITYRFFFGFSHFRSSQNFDLWPLFEKEILPFCVSTGGGGATPLEMWERIKSGDPNPTLARGLGGTYAHDEFERRTNYFATVLAEIIDRISNKAQKFYDEHFASDDPTPVVLKIALTTKPEYKRSEGEFIRPVIKLGLQIKGKTIQKPQIFLNEAKLTQLALSVRFAASLVNLHESDLKLLVLDDLLISLDMSNRMKVVDILLSETFENYQKIILTHDLGFFNEFRLMIGPGQSDWCFRTLNGNARDGITTQNKKSPLEKAEDYLNGHDLEEAALQLRKSAEETAKHYRRFAMKETLCPGKFHSLTANLKAVKKDLEAKLPLSLYHKAITGIPAKHRDKLVSTTDSDIDSDSSLDDATRVKIKCQRNLLKKFLTQASWQHMKAIEILDDVIRMKDRVLNPAAHWGETPLYDAELLKALTLVKRLEKCLKQW